MIWIFKEKGSIMYLYMIIYMLMDVVNCNPLVQDLGYLYECEPIQIDMCNEMPYNMTHMPNFLGHGSQTEASLEISSYNYEYFSGCSEDLQLFICAVYTPMCNMVSYKPFPPCRQLCETVRQGCEPAVNSKGFDWPEHLDCLRYPKSGFCFDKDRSRDRGNGLQHTAPHTTPGSSTSEETRNICSKVKQNNKVLPTTHGGLGYSNPRQDIDTITQYTTVATVTGNNSGYCLNKSTFTLVLLVFMNYMFIET